jgi:hypothetical protein
LRYEFFFHNDSLHAIVYGQALQKRKLKKYRNCKIQNGKTLNYMVVALLLGGVFGFIV